MPLTALDPLPSEIRQLIFQHLQSTTDKPTLATLACVSRAIYAESIPRLYETVRLNAFNAEAFFGRLISDGLGGIDKEIAAHKPYLKHYVSQLPESLERLSSSRFIPSPIARKLCQLWSTDRVLLEDGLAASYLQLVANETEFDYDTFNVSSYLLGDHLTGSLILGESLARCLILYPQVWSGVSKMLKSCDMAMFTSFCVHLPLDCGGPSAALFYQDIWPTANEFHDIEEMCFHNANPLDLMSDIIGQDVHVFLKPESSQGMISHEIGIGALMFYYLNRSIRVLAQIPDNVYFYNSMFTDVDRVSHQGDNFWDILKVRREKETTDWDVQVKIYGPDEKVVCPACLESV
ncbi:hypothetical protein L202_07288 [Cryptococcus amylolentus CBS 6039]|uniref:Uncharacterized protein n=2 Tax=Cryptococcus amylolentus TaxID=104669 RepID=A0A1E3HBP7_9TREE|nr:hypothetical protein L202_07288 [Cryptococcus amylolentus CBS 6039]ODN73753.1 hypothetical protein L202_07288 [Cryptococcus amylolentus CBS 6039]ODO00369.1 hypothetical protein I350_07005 [Cryptococcus amylolentus CBS 6273]